jgi:hypothetical protein
MTDIADGFHFPKDLPTLCWQMVDAIAAIPTHFVPRGTGVTFEDVLIMRSCFAQRLEQLGMQRPATGTTAEHNVTK